MRLRFWRFGESIVPSSIISLQDQIWPAVVELVRVSSMGQIDLLQLFVFDTTMCQKSKHPASPQGTWLRNTTLISKASRVFGNRPRDGGFNPRFSHTKDSKNGTWYTFLNTQHFKVRMKGKWSNPKNGVPPFLTSRCCSYWKTELLGY